MRYMVAAWLAASSCIATAQAQTATVPEQAPTLTLEEAVRAAGGSAPSVEAGNAAIEAARAGRFVAGLRPNPVVQAEVENVLGSGGFRGARSAETTVGIAIPIELGGKRSARIAVADAQLTRAELLVAIAAADVRVQVTGLYVEAVAAERRVAAAREQLRIADELLRGASVRVRAGRASPLEEQRAGVSQVNARAALERAVRLTVAARAGLSLRIGRPVDGELDGTVLDIPIANMFGPAPVVTAGTLVLVAADTELKIAEADVRLARANRMPDVQVGPAIRRLEATDDMAAVFSISVPLPVFNTGRAGIAQASADWRRAEAQRRATVLDIAQAVTEAEAQAANAATTARAAAGPALAAAEEAARIARIGYREGKFGQLELLDAERTLADTRVAAIDALVSFQNARARLERLTAPAPQEGIR